MKNTFRKTLTVLLIAFTLTTSYHANAILLISAAEDTVDRIAPQNAGQGLFYVGFCALLLPICALDTQVATDQYFNDQKLVEILKDNGFANPEKIKEEFVNLYKSLHRAKQGVRAENETLEQCLNSIAGNSSFKDLKSPEAKDAFCQIMTNQPK